jgi:hypothetical protein
VAGAITIDGITIGPGALLETIDLFESERNGGVISAVGDELIGIGIVNRILDAGNNVLWQNGDNGRELTLYFQGYFAESFSTTSIPNVIGVDVVNFSGGVLTLYSDNTPNFSAAGTLPQGIATATDGNVWLTLAGSPIGGFGANTGSPITLTSTGLRNGDVGAPFSFANNITGTGLLDVTGGPAAVYLDTNTFGCIAGAGQPCPDDADKTFTSSGQIPVSPGGSWAFRGTGEVQDFAAIPEPTTLALLGLGLASLGMRSRRKA